jgi:hydrogenase maturation protease
MSPVRKRILIAGIGAPEKPDGAFGSLFLERLAERLRDPAVELLDAGEMGLHLLPHLERRELIAAAGALDFGLQPGDLVKIRAADLRKLPRPKVAGQVPAIGEALALFDLLESQPREFLLFGVQPAPAAGGARLSPGAEQAISPLVDEVVRRIGLWKEEHPEPDYARGGHRPVHSRYRE